MTTLLRPCVSRSLSSFLICKETCYNVGTSQSLIHGSVSLPNDPVFYNLPIHDELFLFIERVLDGGKSPRTRLGTLSIQLSAISVQPNSLNAGLLQSGTLTPCLLLGRCQRSSESQIEVYGWWLGLTCGNTGTCEGGFWSFPLYMQWTEKPQRNLPIKMNHGTDKMWM